MLQPQTRRRSRRHRGRRRAWSGCHARGCTCTEASRARRGARAATAMTRAPPSSRARRARAVRRGRARRAPLHPRTQASCRSACCVPPRPARSSHVRHPRRAARRHRVWQPGHDGPAEMGNGHGDMLASQVPPGAHGADVYSAHPNDTTGTWRGDAPPLSHRSTLSVRRRSEGRGARVRSWLSLHGGDCIAAPGLSDAGAAHACRTAEGV